jgi:uncharacterized membrane protein
MPTPIELAENTGIALQIGSKTYSPEETIKTIKKSGTTFYYIAGFTIINAILVLSKTDSMLIGGLGAGVFAQAISMGIDADASMGMANMASLLGIIINLVLASFFVLFGVYGSRGFRWPVLIGMFAYLADTLLFVMIDDWLSVILHVFFLVLLSGSFLINNQLHKQLHHLHQQ